LPLVPPAPATLNGTVDLTRKKAKGDSTWITPLVVRFFYTDKTEVSWSPLNATTDAYGNFTISDITPGVYDVGIKNFTALSELELNRTFTAGNTTNITFTKLREGDSSDGNDRIKLPDFNLILNAYGATPGQPKWNANCDLDRGGKVDLVDFNLVLTNYNKDGDIYKYQH